MTLYDIYSEILSKKENWNSTKAEIEIPDISKLFSYPDSYSFIMQLAFWDGNFHPLGIKLYSISKKIKKERLSHTASLYLLGVAVCSKLELSKLNLPTWDNDLFRNFIHHWAGTCIFHDYGYYIENDKDGYPTCKFKTIDELINVLNLRYDLRNSISEKDKKLIDNYYKYRIERCECVDHGIISALVLYDTLMKRNQEFQEMAKTAYIFYEKEPYGEAYKNSVIKYATEIAKHNMWFSDNDTIDIYKNYGLSDLICKVDGSHKRKAAEEPVLFLLCLLDTFEPIKLYLKNESNEIDILNKIDIDVSYIDEKLNITVASSYSDLYSKMKGCEKWLDLNVNKIDEKSFEISVQF